MASKYLAIVSDIKSNLEAVPGAGIVHRYERQSADLGKFIALFRDPATGKFLGGEITRRAVTERQAGSVFRIHQFVLRWYRSLEDAAGSSEQFQVLIDDICERFRDRSSPDGATWEYRDADNSNNTPIQAEIINDRMFGAVLCHCAELVLTVTERIAP